MLCSGHVLHCLDSYKNTGGKVQYSRKDATSFYHHSNTKPFRVQSCFIPQIITNQMVERGPGFPRTASVPKTSSVQKDQR